MAEINEKIPHWFKGEENIVSVYSSVRISRNYTGMNFPSSPGYSLYKEVEKKTDDVLAEHLISKRIIKFSLSAIPQEEILRMKRLRILPEKRNDILIRLALYYDEKNRSYLLTNYIDHLTFFSHSQGTGISSAFRNCRNFADLFENAGPAKDSRGNYLTSGIDYFGSGLKCFSVLSVPVLRIAGKIGEIRSSLEYNGMSVQSYFRTAEDFILIISNRDSFSVPQGEILRKFKEVMKELKKMSANAADDPGMNYLFMRKRLYEIINSEHLTFKDFIEIYDILSFLRWKGKIKLRISELNRVLVLLMQESSGIVSGGALKRSLTDGFLKKAAKTINKEVAK
ncbi:MAG TPA: hypothetical protein PKW56_00930 [Clostridiales bacterium]|nr:hypothetical protein [Clostridiales bacterium]